MLAFCAATLLLHTLVVAASGNDAPQCSSEAFTDPQIGRGVTILSVEAQPQYNFTSDQGAPWQPALSGLSFCQVRVFLTHQARNHVESQDNVLVEIWLPLDAHDWNGRLQATGGGGFAAGMMGAHLGEAIKKGWAAVSTDGGHDPAIGKFWDASWLSTNTKTHDGRSGKNGNRDINWGLLHNFASRSTIDQILIAKSITHQYYGSKPHHSYWNGCSTGGRQGYAVAQKYPELLDGILATAPAASFVNLVVGELWPLVVMNKAKVYPSNCELEYFRYQAIKACESEYDLKTGILEDPQACEWTPTSLVGEAFECEGQQVTISQEMAGVVQAIHDGPGSTVADKKFTGLAWGVPMTVLTDITTTEDGTRSANPFSISANWLRQVILQDENFDFSTLDEDRWYSLWVSALSEFGGILNTDDPDLSKLRDSGTKMLTWHGIDDPAIPYQHTIEYRRKVEAIMGHDVDDYYRLFLAPGVLHCGGGVGPVPKDPLDSLVRWVEDNEQPETLEAEIVGADGDLITRNLCIYPAVARYIGIGDTKRASTWTCVGGTERPSTAEQVVESEFDYGSMHQAPLTGGGRKKEPGSHDNDKPDKKSGRAEEILGGLKDRIEGLGLGLHAQ
ncbi:carboxylic ester hydrolase [Parastagonospora nodorum]|nr:carboxylic ester hydrolase [Parastagonospora nodorum]KAH4162629.1 carboxylic ester hydrolase [Parastagonospora nodorum]KAH4301771.1 carboxylic ester hydrolase [Parastagonospora nodorum]KAH4306540.1 carboxylic ester hydrolase [Parastagonospora nodorum]KAH4330568.1 carboxylic ester hydrolase [Parastagonospora nodorum]